MECSPARLAANRANALLSKGPTTEEGKIRSRANAYKHGMAGDGVVVPVEDEVEVSRRTRALEAEFQPGTDLDRSLVRRVALLSIRLDRCEIRDSAATSARVLSAVPDFDEGRLADVERLMGELDIDPALAVRQLRRTAEGVDRMVAAWLSLKSDLTCSAENRWGASHRQLAEQLTGRLPGEIGLSRVEILARAIRGDLTLLSGPEIAGMSEKAQSAWARERMVELIDEEVAGLQAHRGRLDLDLVARLRGYAPDIALFDASKPAQLARRYEAEAERGLFRALRELRQRGKAEPTRRLAVTPVTQVSPIDPATLGHTQATLDLLGSFRAAEAAALLPPVAASKRRPDPSKMRPMPPSQRDRAGQNAPRDASTIVVGRG